MRTRVGKYSVIHLPFPLPEDRFLPFAPVLLARLDMLVELVLGVGVVV